MRSHDAYSSILNSDEMADMDGSLCERSPGKRIRLETENQESSPEHTKECPRTDDRALRRDLRVKRHLCKKSSFGEPARVGRRAESNEGVSSTSDFMNTEVPIRVDSTRSEDLLSAECVSAIVESLTAVVSEKHDRALGSVTEADSSVIYKNNDDDDGTEDIEDDIASTISNVSGLSDLSDVSGLDWKPVSAPFIWAQHQMELGISPRNLMQELVPMGTVIPPHLDDVSLWRIACSILCEPPQRKKLNNINTLDDVVHLLRVSKKVIVLTGAGVSVSSGIPDFRSRDGIYARLANDFPDLPDPQAMFDIHYFRKDPRPFFKFAREIYPGQFSPSLSHRFIKLLEDHGKLLRNYSQNIDTLEQIAGIQNVIQCHGSFATATCTSCGYKTDSDAIKDNVFQQNIPKCPMCSLDDDPAAQVDGCWQSRSVMKPDIVFFGEGLPEEFHSTMAEDKEECDLLIVIGSSLKVRPVALIPYSLPWDVPQILINREPLAHLTFDVELLGDCDVIINEICLRLKDGWEHNASGDKLRQVSRNPDGQPSCEANGSIHRPDIYPIGPPACDSTSDRSCEPSQSDNPDSTGCDNLNIDMTDQVGDNGGCFVFVPPNRYEFSGAEVSIQAPIAPNVFQSLSMEPSIPEPSIPAGKTTTRCHSSLSDNTDDTSSGESTAGESDGGPSGSTEFDERGGSCASGEDSGVGDVRGLPKEMEKDCRTVEENWSKVET